MVVIIKPRAGAGAEARAGARAGARTGAAVGAGAGARAGVGVVLLLFPRPTLTWACLA